MPARRSRSWSAAHALGTRSTIGGNRFLCNIRNPVQQVVFENRYLTRNPYLAVSNALYDVAEPGDTLPVYRASPPEPFRAARALRYRNETGGTSLPRSELAGAGY